MSLTVVWYKRDLRLTDHAPLYHAAQNGPVIPVYVIEPELWQQPDTSLRHWQFILDTILELDGQLAMLGQGLWVAEDGIVNCLEALLQHFGEFQLFSHQEFGNQWTRQRNQGVTDWCADNNIKWIQFQPCGVFRGATSRATWCREWREYMLAPTLPAPKSLTPVAATPLRPELWPEELGYERRACSHRQIGGRKAGLEELSSFLKVRGVNYQQNCALPSASYYCSSRLSPYIANGVLSIREVFRQVTRAERHYVNRKQQRWSSSMQAHLQRLQSHCHYIQQFDDEPAMEYRTLHKSYVGLRENDYDESLFQAWAEGKTGFPIIDAAMRALAKYGWINFRLRALLVSFASYQLWLHWREPALHLARLTTDYEPGIHYPLVQALAGTGGMRQWRISDPVAESQEIDPDGVFIKAECPELAEVKRDYVHCPWLMSAGEQLISECVLGEDYPLPIVDHKLEACRAQQKITSWLSGNYDPAETERLIDRHGSAEIIKDFQDKCPTQETLDSLKASVASQRK